MSESSEDNKENKETIEPVTVKVEESEESSSSIRKDDDDDVYFPSNTDDIQKLNFISNTTSSKPINNNIGALGPDHMYLKKNLFRANSLQKSDSKKASEALSTSRGSDRGSFIRVRNYNSPKKDIQYLNLLKKIKDIKKTLIHSFLTKKIIVKLKLKKKK